MIVRFRFSLYETFPCTLPSTLKTFLTDFLSRQKNVNDALARRSFRANQSKNSWEDELCKKCLWFPWSVRVSQEGPGLLAIGDPLKGPYTVCRVKRRAKRSETWIQGQPGRDLCLGHRDSSLDFCPRKKLIVSLPDKRRQPKWGESSYPFFATILCLCVDEPSLCLFLGNV